jgi:hypothetical protein
LANYNVEGGSYLFLKVCCPGDRRWVELLQYRLLSVLG